MCFHPFSLSLLLKTASKGTQCLKLLARPNRPGTSNINSISEHGPILSNALCPIGRCDARRNRSLVLCCARCRFEIGRVPAPHPRLSPARLGELARRPRVAVDRHLPGGVPRSAKRTFSTRGPTTRRPNVRSSSSPTPLSNAPGVAPPWPSAGSPPGAAPSSSPKSSASARRPVNPRQRHRRRAEGVPSAPSGALRRLVQSRAEPRGTVSQLRVS